MMNTARSATADAFARAPLPKRFCNLDRLLHAMKARGLDGIVATAPWNVMKLPRRNFLHLAAGAAALPAVSRFAWAQTYPVRPVTIIMPVALGGTTDVAARIIGEYMARLLGQQFIVENVPGAGGTTGSSRCNYRRGRQGEVP